jgi:hypothetical protein
VRAGRGKENASAWLGGDVSPIGLNHVVASASHSRGSFSGKDTVLPKSSGLSNVKSPWARWRSGTPIRQWCRGTELDSQSVKRVQRSPR